MTGAARVGLLALLWGSTFLWIKIALRGFSAVQVTFLRMVIGAAVLLLVVWFLRRKSRAPVPWGHVVVSAALANAIPYLLFTLAENEISSSAAGVINSTTPIWTLLTAWACGQHRAGRTGRQVAGLVAGFLGCLLIFSPWQAGSDLMSRGGLECLAGSMLLGVSYVYMAQFLTGRGVSPLVLSTAQLSVAGALLVPALPIDGLPAPQPRADAWAALAVLGLLGTGAAYILNYRIITDDGSVAASLVTYLVPAVSIVLGAAVLGERLTLPMLAGVVTVFAGVAIARRREHREPGVPAPDEHPGTEEALSGCDERSA